MDLWLAILYSSLAGAVLGFILSDRVLERISYFLMDRSGPGLYALSPWLRQIHSPNPEDIGVSGNPPLCKCCTFVFAKIHELPPTDSWDVLLRNFQRLKTSAKLGCYLCRILYHVKWVVRSAGPSNTPITEKLERFGQDLRFIRYRLSEPKSWIAEPCYYISFMALSDRTKDIWNYELLLVPENVVDDKLVELERLPSFITADIVAQLGRTWIKDCHQSHIRCAISPSSRKLPTRLINVGLGADAIPRLCLTSGLRSNTRYTALSHCWGRTQNFKLLMSNIEEMLLRIPTHRLTKLFNDSFDLSRLMGVEYIWIDSLCIIQDSHDDWAREAVGMGDVYQNAWCTISATGFMDGQAGLYGPRDPTTIFPRKFSMNILDTTLQGDNSNLRKSVYYCTEDIIQTSITMAPLSQRAWVYQERFLSPRVLHIGSCQIFWECNEVEACELFPRGLPNHLKKHFKPNLPEVVSLNSLYPGKSNEELSDHPLVHNGLEELLMVWDRVKEEYNNKDLTFYTDKYTALAGITKTIGGIIKDQNIAGLWKRFFMYQLLWFCARLDLHQAVTRKRPEHYQAPSWSWLSVNESVRDLAVRILTRDSTLLSTLLDYSITYSVPGADFGQIIDGYIRVRGKLSSVSIIQTYSQLFWPADEDDNISLKVRSRDVNFFITPTLHPDFYPATNDPRSGIPIRNIRIVLGTLDFHLLQVYREHDYLCGLILHLTPIAGQYTRLGAWYLRKYENSSAKDFEIFLSHFPVLKETDYEELNDNGQCIITII